MRDEYTNTPTLRRYESRSRLMISLINGIWKIYETLWTLRCNKLHYDLGIVLHDLGKNKQAESAYRTALKLNPNHAEAYNNLGTIFGQSGDHKAASEMFAKALALNPDYAAAADNLARARKALGQ